MLASFRSAHPRFSGAARPRGRVRRDVRRLYARNNPRPRPRAPGARAARKYYRLGLSGSCPARGRASPYRAPGSLRRTRRGSRGATDAPRTTRSAGGSSTAAAIMSMGAASTPARGPAWTRLLGSSPAKPLPVIFHVRRVAGRITPNLCTIGAHTYSSKKTVRDATPRKVCRKFCEAASASGRLALKHVHGLTCYCKRK